MLLNEKGFTLKLFHKGKSTKLILLNTGFNENMQEDLFLAVALFIQRKQAVAGTIGSNPVRIGSRLSRSQSLAEYTVVSLERLDFS